MQHFCFRLTIRDGENEYTSPLLGIAYLGEDSGEVAQAIASQELTYQSFGELEGSWWSFDTDYRMVKVEGVSDIDPQTYEVLHQELTAMEVNVPARLKCEEKVLHFQRVAESDSFRQIYTDGNVTYSALAAYFKLVGSEDADPSLPDFEVESWLDADFSQ